MTVDEAVKQLSFVNKKGAKFVKEAILEAQELAVTRHNVEFKSNLWIGMYFYVHMYMSESGSDGVARGPRWYFENVIHGGYSLLQG